MSNHHYAQEGDGFCILEMIVIWYEMDSDLKHTSMFITNLTLF